MTTENQPAKLRRSRGKSSVLNRSEPMLWLTGGGLVVSLAMIIWLLLLIIVNGLNTFWPGPMQVHTLRDGSSVQGEFAREEFFQPSRDFISTIPEEHLTRYQAAMDANSGQLKRQLVRVGNTTNPVAQFKWFRHVDRVEGGVTEPEWGMVIERQSGGRYYGTLAAIIEEGTVPAHDATKAWDRYQELLPGITERNNRIYNLKRFDIGSLSKRRESARLGVKRALRMYGEGSPEVAKAEENAAKVNADADAEQATYQEEITQLKEENAKYVVRITTPAPAGAAADAALPTIDIPLADIVRGYTPNRMGLSGKMSVYLSRWWDFIFDEPREAGAEGGVWPSIVGTVVLTMIMTVIAVPFGVLAALYLREYARQGLLVSSIRIAINNLAGVPSIVFGVFGLGFFCYMVGGWIDFGAGEAAWQPGFWWTGLLILAVLTTFAGFATYMRLQQKPALTGKVPVGWMWSMGLGWTAAVLWMFAWIYHSPYFEGFYLDKYPTPTYGTGGVFWAACTLALLTLPVVIVATEEALAAVPRSMREGSYGCGASKWQTMARIVIPRAMPGIMTGAILAMARGAGEVAPIMLTGAVQVAPDAPFTFFHDWSFPFGPLHPERSFLHLGLQIYNVGFKIPNAEAGKPMVYTITLLLVAIVLVLNIMAIYIRTQLKKRYASSQF